MLDLLIRSIEMLESKATEGTITMTEEALLNKFIEKAEEALLELKRSKK